MPQKESLHNKWGHLLSYHQPAASDSYTGYNRIVERNLLLNVVCGSENESAVNVLIGSPWKQNTIN